MADIDDVRQTAPGPLCNPTNIFSGAVVAAGDGVDEATAKSAAEGLARRRRDTLQQQDRNRRQNCPGGCQDGAGSNARRGVGEIITIKVDTTTPVFVSYAFARWKVIVDCPTRNKTYRNLADSTAFKLVRHATALVCPGKRVLTGCALAYAIRTKSKDAKTAAKALAEQKADVGLAEDRAKRCPANAAGKACAPTVRGPQRSAGTKLWSVHEIKQAKQNSIKKYIAYYAAYWQVEIECSPPPAKGAPQEQ